MNAYWRGPKEQRPAAARRFMDAQTTEVMDEIIEIRVLQRRAAQQRHEREAT